MHNLLIYAVFQSLYYGKRLDCLTFKEVVVPDGHMCRLARCVICDNYLVFTQQTIIKYPYDLLLCNFYKKI